MAKKVVIDEPSTPTVTVKDLLGYLKDIPPETEVYVETTEDIDVVGGCVYFPRHKLFSLVGQRTELDIDEEDWESAVRFGDIALYDEAEDGSTDVSAPPTEEAINSTAVEVVVEAKPAKPRNEVDAPARPARTH